MRSCLTFASRNHCCYRYSLIVLCFLLSTGLVYPQVDPPAPRSRDRYGTAFIPSAAGNIYGIAIGPIGSESICNLTYPRNSYGINIQLLGYGMFQAVMPQGLLPLASDTFATIWSENMTSLDIFERTTHHGLLVSALGTYTGYGRGAAISGWMSAGQEMKGLSVNLLWNIYHEMHGLSAGLVNHSAWMQGVQLGIFNNSRHLRGIQIGLLNKSGETTQPLINWGRRSEIVPVDFQEHLAGFQPPMTQGDVQYWQVRLDMDVESKTLGRRIPDDIIVSDPEGKLHSLRTLLPQPCIIQAASPQCGAGYIALFENMPVVMTRYKEEGRELNTICLVLDLGYSEEAINNMVDECLAYYPETYIIDSVQAFRINLTASPSRYYVKRHGLVTHMQSGCSTAERLYEEIRRYYRSWWVTSRRWMVVVSE